MKLQKGMSDIWLTHRRIWK